MAKRKQTPDVLAALLEGKEQQPEEAPEEAPETTSEQPQEPTTPAEQQASKTVSQPTSKPARRRAKKRTPPPSGDKIKATYYLSPETLDSLDEARLRLRKMAGRAKRGQVSSSLIVEMALQMALEELEDKGEESQLASMLA